MTSFKDGRFAFLDADQRLRVESECRSNNYSLFYGGEVHAFAINEAQSMIALACPSDAATGLGPSEGANKERCCIRLFRIAEDALGDLLAELNVPTANQLLWVGERFLVASCPSSLTTIMELTAKLKLKIFVQDKGKYPFTVGGLLGLVSGADGSAPTIEMWDLQKNKRVETIKLGKKPSGTGSKHKCGSKGGGVLPGTGNVRIVGSCSSGNFAVLGNSDGSFEAIYGGSKSSVKLLTRVVTRRCSSSQLAKGNPQRGTNQSPNGSSPRSNSVLCIAPSPSHVLVALGNTGEIGRYSYLKKDTTLHEEGTSLVGDENALVALSQARYLVRKSPEEGKPTESPSLVKKPTYVPYPIVLSTSAANALAGTAAGVKGGNGVAATEGSPSGFHPVGGEPTEGASGGKGDVGEEEGVPEKKKRKRKRNKKKSVGADDDSSDGGPRKEGARDDDGVHNDGSDGFSAIGLIAGICCVAVAVAVIQLRRRS